MHNIPPLKSAQLPTPGLNRRANKIMQSENSTANQIVLPKTDRRKQRERRKKQHEVSLERRHLHNNRRKTNFFAQDAEHSASLDDTLGKFINTEV